MKLMAQFVGSGPADFITMDSKDWASLGRVKGNEFNVQGCSFNGYDRYLVEDLPLVNGCKLYGWNDDPILFPVGHRNGVIITFLPLAPDDRLGGAYNTRQAVQNFVEGDRWDCRRLIGNTTWDHWSSMPIIDTDRVKDGLMLSDEDLALYTAALSPCDWRDWTEGLPMEEIVDGKLRSQREAGRWQKARGTKTYFHDDNNAPQGIHIATQEKLVQTGIGNGNSAVTTVSGEGDSLGWLFTGQAGQPDSDDWPNGEYRCQFDVGTGNGSVTYGLLTQGASDGHFARIDVGRTADQEIWTQDESAFSSTGLKLATNTINPVPGLQNDRLEYLVSIEDARPHGGNVTTRFDFGADSFVDGPWSGLFPGEDDPFLPSAGPEPHHVGVYS